MIFAEDAYATEGVTLSGVPRGTGLRMDRALENPIDLGAEGARAGAIPSESLRQKDKVFKRNAVPCGILPFVFDFFEDALSCGIFFVLFY